MTFKDPKVITIAAIEWAVYHFFILACCYNISVYHCFERLPLLQWTWLPVTLQSPSSQPIKI